MRTLKSIFLLYAVLLLASCGNGTSRLSTEEEQLCGGYSESREPTDEEYQLFRSVTDTVQGMAFTPLTLQTQVVAGINYRFYCRFSDGSEKYSPGHCYLTIFKPLPGRGNPSITSVEKTE